MVFQNDLLTLWKHIPMGQFHTNIFWQQLLRTMYFWGLVVCKRQTFKSQSFWFQNPKLKSRINFYAKKKYLVIIKNLQQFSEKFHHFLDREMGRQKQLTFKTLIFANCWASEVVWSSCYQKNNGAELNHWHSDVTLTPHNGRWRWILNQLSVTSFSQYS